MVDDGVKYDDSKVPAGIVYCQFPLTASCRGFSEQEEIALRLCAEYGEKKYPDRFNWKKVPDAARRYTDAGFRHLNAVRNGEYYDPESKLPHIYHVLWNGIAVLELCLSTACGNEWLFGAMKLIGSVNLGDENNEHY